MVIYAVSSLRDYGGGEVYFGTDGVFKSREDAMEYIRGDVRETMENYKTVYELEEDPMEIDWEGDEYSDVRIVHDDHVFRWLIDQFTINMESEEVIS